jgi:S-DNA-T family DNA segregation ATPase FtsK/SpoIIIE
VPVELQVRQVRDEILRAVGGPLYGLPDASTRVTGTLFHEIFAELIGPDPRLHAAAALAGGSTAFEEWRTELREHIYKLLLGPRLRANQAALQPATRELLDLWKSLEELARWLAGILFKAWQKGAFSVSDEDGAGIFLSPEHSISWLLEEPGWTDSVRVNGVADALLRLPGSDRWCVVELKTGNSAGEADLAQACLYYQMLAASERAPGALAVVHFRPRLEEKVFAPGDLKTVEARLKAVIGRLAGVLPGPAPVPPAIRPPAVAEPAALRPEHHELGRKLQSIFREYGQPVELRDSSVAGPSFLRFPIQPARGVRPEAIERLAGAVQVRLELLAPPFIHKADGRLVVDVARPDRQPVLFASVRDQMPLPDPDLGSSKLPVGVDLEGRLRMADLADSADCHFLVAGTTGSGKSEWLRAMIAGLVVTNTPETLQLLLVDPKRNAFNELAGSPYLWNRSIVYPDERSPIDFLDQLVDEMESRYRQFQGAGVDHLAGLQAQGVLTPRIVCVCDEYADLISHGRKDIEERIRRLGQKARAAGIHLVLAVQQPSREIVKGTLQATIPARVGLRVTSRIESHMLLNRAGAEDLLGNGDLLFKDIGEPVRLQGLYLPPEERRRIFQGATDPRLEMPIK